MSLNPEDREALIALYWKKAVDTIAEARIAIQAEAWNMAANRVYYAAFHAVSSLLIKDSRPFGTHKGAKISFTFNYVNTGIFSKEEGRLYAQLESLRNNADYDCTFTASKEEILKFFQETTSLIEHIDHYIHS